MHLSNEKEICQDHYTKNVTRDSSGRYQVSLLFNYRKQELGHSCTMASRRFYRLERKFKAGPGLNQAYVEFLREYKELGHMTEINSDARDGYFILIMQ